VDQRFTIIDIIQVRPFVQHSLKGISKSFVLPTKPQRGETDTLLHLL